jgi:hypothetical protein
MNGEGMTRLSLALILSCRTGFAISISSNIETKGMQHERTAKGAFALEGNHHCFGYDKKSQNAKH